MAATAGLVLGVLGLLPPLIQACSALRHVCADIGVHEEGCLLLVEHITYLEETVTAAVEAAAVADAEPGATHQKLREDVNHLTK